MLIDRFGRKITNLRISLTQRCNLKCIYCHHEGEAGSRGNAIDEISADEIGEIVRTAASLGIRKIKFTGGEPTLRKDLCEILSAVPPDIEASMTTNGTLLADLAGELKASGLSRVNVSLDTLKPERYARITGRDVLHSVLEGIDAALDCGLVPVKLNMVLLKGLNEDEVEDFIGYARRKKGLVLQVIELMDYGECALHADVSAFERSLAARAEGVLTRKMHHRKKYLFNGAEVEVVRPMHNTEFCAFCNRLRVTSKGELKPCLLRSDNHVNIRGLRGRELVERFYEAVEKREPFFR